MHKLNTLFTLSSLSVVLVTIERFSVTTKILLQPYNYFRFHEIFQMIFLIMFTVVIPFFILYFISDNFRLFTRKSLVWLPLLFIVGVYYYSTGNGVHEMASFTLNQYCNVKSIAGIFCNGQFYDDYYTGNIFYFVGGICMVLSLLFTEKIFPNTTYKKKDVAVTVINAVIYASAIFAYSAFDPVLVGLVYSFLIMIVADVLFVIIRKRYLQHPVIFYTSITYTVGTIAGLFVRFH
jgi:hypothetical protein